MAYTIENNYILTFVGRHIKVTSFFFCSPLRKASAITMAVPLMALLLCSGCVGKQMATSDNISSSSGYLTSAVSYVPTPAGNTFSSSESAHAQPGSVMAVSAAGTSTASLPGAAAGKSGGRNVPAATISAVRPASSKATAKSGSPSATPFKVSVPSGGAADYPYGEIPVSQWNTRIKNITTDQLNAIPKNTPYKDIIAKFGESFSDYQLSAYSAYSVDNSKLLLLHTVDNNGICPLSGEELLAQAATVNSKYDSRSVSFCIVVDKLNNNCLSVINPLCQFGGPYALHYYELSIDKDAKIIFENGTPATIDDIRFNQGLAVTCYGAVQASVPAHAHVSQIRILR